MKLKYLRKHEFLFTQGPYLQMIQYTLSIRSKRLVKNFETHLSISKVWINI